MAQKLTAAQRRALKREAVGWDELSDEDFARLFGEGQPVKVRSSAATSKNTDGRSRRADAEPLKAYSSTQTSPRPSPSRHMDRRATHSRAPCPEMIVQRAVGTF